MALPSRLRAAAALTVLVLAGCAGGPRAPEWQSNAAELMQAFERDYLAGRTARAEAQFNAARSELTATGRADVVARAELIRCAVRTASLEFDACPGFQRLRDDADPEEVAYAEYLMGRSGRAPGEAPLSKLVALAVALRSGTITPQGIASAVDIASAQGWRRPLLAWLGVELKRAEQAGDAAAAERVRRRMDLISG